MIKVRFLDTRVFIFVSLFKDIQVTCTKTVKIKENTLGQRLFVLQHATYQVKGDNAEILLAPPTVDINGRQYSEGPTTR